MLAVVSGAVFTAGIFVALTLPALCTPKPANTTTSTAAARQTHLRCERFDGPLAAVSSENVSEEEIEAVLTEINRRLAEDDGSARQNEKEIILEKEAMLRKRMQMAAEVRQ